MRMNAVHGHTLCLWGDCYQVLPSLARKTMLVVAAARAAALCSRRTFKRLNASFHSAGILSITASGSGIVLRGGLTKPSWFYYLALRVFCSFQNYQLPLMAITPLFCLKKSQKVSKNAFTKIKQ